MKKKLLRWIKKYEKVFKTDKPAWKFFLAQAPSYQKQMIHRIMDVKQESTPLSRLEKLMNVSKAAKRLP